MMFGRKKRELTDDELAMQTLKNCQMSMGQIFHEQTAAERIASDEEFMRGFVDSPEYKEAFAAYAKRMGKE